MRYGIPGLTLFLLLAQFQSGGLHASPRCAYTALEPRSGLAGFVFDASTLSCVDGIGDCKKEEYLASDRDRAPRSLSLPAVLEGDLWSTGVFYAAHQSLPPPTDECLQTQLTKPIKWIGTATWVNDPPEILVLDPAAKKLLSVTTNGSVQDDEVRGALAAPPGQLARIDMIGAGEGYVLTTKDWQLHLTDSTCRARRGKSSLGQGATRISSYTDIAVLGKDLVGYGALTTEGSGGTSLEQLGFFHAAIDEGRMTLGGPRMLKKLDKQIYYTLGHRYIAANDSGLFFLSMGDSAEIYKYSPGDAGPTKLGAVPAAYSNVPVLNGNRNLSGKRDLDIVFEEIRNQRMAVGLYGQGRFLYLLTREPESGEKTKWLLHQIDARAGTVTGRVRLPTSSKNLTIVPAPSAWHVFERGSLSDLDGVRTLITVPAPWITNPRTSPLKDENSGVACRQYDERAKPSSSAAPRASLDHDLDTD